MVPILLFVFWHALFLGFGGLVAWEIARWLVR